MTLNLKDKDTARALVALAYLLAGQDNINVTLAVAHLCTPHGWKGVTTSADMIVHAATTGACDAEQPSHPQVGKPVLGSNSTNAARIK